MSRTGWIALASLLSLVFAIGCSGSAEPETAAGDGSLSPPVVGQGEPVGSTSNAPASRPANANLTPEEAVSRFLDALRSGDEVVAAAMLTEKARTETAKHDLTVQPPGTPNATYRVGGVEYVTEAKDGAHVTSIWTEKNQEQSHSYDIIWVLRKQLDGWRIAGMATQVVPNQPPLFLNFEDPADMLNKWEKADSDLATEEGKQPAASTAQRPQVQPTAPR